MNIVPGTDIPNPYWEFIRDHLQCPIWQCSNPLYPIRIDAIDIDRYGAEDVSVLTHAIFRVQAVCPIHGQILPIVFDVRDDRLEELEGLLGHLHKLDPDN